MNPQDQVERFRSQFQSEGTPERAALLSLPEPLRRGDGDFELFARLAVPMLGEKEFFIRKAIGWVLREGAKHLPAPLRDAFPALRR